MTDNPEILRAKFLPSPSPLLPFTSYIIGNSSLLPNGIAASVLVRRAAYSSRSFAVSQLSLDLFYLAFVIVETVFIFLTIHLPMPLVHAPEADWVCTFCDVISETGSLSDYKKTLLFSGNN